MKTLGVKQPAFMLILINIISFGLLYFYREPLDNKILIVGSAVLAITLITYFIIYFKCLGDLILFTVVSMLVTLGMVMLCRLDYELGIKQVGWYLISIIAFYIVFFIYSNMKNLAKLKYFYIIISVVLFLSTLIFGTERGGAKNWISLGFISFQPSEFIRLLFVFYLASYFSGDKKKLIHGIRERYIVFLVMCIHMCFFVLQREWGTMLLLFIIYMIMEYVYESDPLLIAGTVLIGSTSGFLGYKFLYHIQVRISNWIDPWSDISNKGYQITQSLFGIASGGFFGKGLGLGHPEYIPEVKTDFIFSAICEELGIFGGVAIILLYFIFVYRGMKIALSLDEGFDKCVAVGITSLFAFQTFIIIGGVIKLIPLTGITLPFISFGGSSLLTSFISLGILQAISAKGVQK